VAEPLRILVAGQISAGKSSLINALAQEVAAAVDALPTTPAFTAHGLKRGGFPAALLIDSPGLGTGPGDAALLIENAAEARHSRTEPALTGEGHGSARSSF
jgi:predicted GTPase